MKRFRRVLSVAVTFILIVTLFTDSLSAAFTGPVFGGEFFDIFSLGQTMPQGDIVPLDEGSGGSTESYTGEQYDLKTPDVVELRLNNENGSLSPDHLNEDGSIALESFSSGDILKYFFQWNFAGPTDLSGKYATFTFSCDYLDLNNLSGDLVENGITKGRFTVVKGEGNTYTLVLEFNEYANSVTSVSVSLGSTLPGDPNNYYDGQSFDEQFFNKTFNFKYTNEESKVDVSKSRTSYQGMSVTKNSDGTYVFHQPYTVTATVTGKAFDFTFSDILSGLDENLKNKANVHNFSVSYNNPHGVSDTSVTNKVDELNNTYGNSNTFDPSVMTNWTFGGRLYNGDTLTFTYCIDFVMSKEEAIEYLNGTKNFNGVNNAASWSYKQTDSATNTVTGTTPEGDGTKPSFQKYSVGKNGSAPYEENNEWFIDWTVEINLNSLGDMDSLPGLLGVDTLKEALALLGIDNFTDVLDSNLELYPEGTTFESIFDLNNTNNTHLKKDGSKLTFTYKTKIKKETIGSSSFTNVFHYGDDGKADYTVFGPGGDISYSKSGTGVDDNGSEGAELHWQINVNVPPTKRGTEEITIYDYPGQLDINEGYTHRIVTDTLTDGSTSIEDSVRITYYYMEGSELRSNTVNLTQAKALTPAITYEILTNSITDQEDNQWNSQQKFFDYITNYLKISVPKEYTYGNILVTVYTEVIDNATGKRVETTEEAVNDAIISQWGAYPVGNATNGTRNFTNQNYPYSKKPDETPVNTNMSKDGVFNADDYTTGYSLKITDFGKATKDGLADGTVLKKLIDSNSNLTFTDTLSYKDTTTTGQKLIIKYVPDSFKAYLYSGDGNYCYYDRAYRVLVQENGQYYLKDIYNYISKLLTDSLHVNIDDEHKTATFSISAAVLKAIGELEIYQIGNSGFGENEPITSLESIDVSVLGGWYKKLGTAYQYNSGESQINLGITYKTVIDEENLPPLFLLSKDEPLSVQNTVVVEGGSEFDGLGYKEVLVQHHSVLKKEGEFDEDDINKYKATEAYTARTPEGQKFFDDKATLYQNSPDPYNARNFFFKIDVNPDAKKVGKNYATDPDSRIRLEDILGTSLSVIPDSLNVYEYRPAANEYGYEIAPLSRSEWHYNITSDPTTGKEKLVIDLPDEKHLLVEYWTLVTPNGDKDNAGVYDVADASNEVSMSVYGDSKTVSSEKPDKTKTSSGAIVSAYNSLQITKFWKYNLDDNEYYESLNDKGVEFELYKAALTNGVLGYSPADIVDKYPAENGTMPDGQIKINVSATEAAKNIYCLVETKTPTTSDPEDPDKNVHFTPAEPIYFVFYCYNDKELLPPNVKQLGSMNTLNVENKRSKVEKGTLSLTKKVQVFDGGIAAPDETFEFRIELKDSDNKTYDVTADKCKINNKAAGTDVLTISGNIITVQLKKDEQFTITDLPVGTKYTISETNDHSDKGFVNFTGKYASGEVLAGDITEVGVDETWVNEYTAVIPEISKAVTGITGTSNEEFTFNLEELNTSTAPYKDTATVIGAGKVTFKPIIYTEPGTYTYKITEEKGNNPLIKYFGGKVILTVKVEKKDDNHLSITEKHYTVDGTDVSTVTNEYVEAPSTSIRFNVSKTISGKDEWDDNDVYTIKLEGTDISEKTVVLNKKNTSGQFEQIPYTYDPEDTDYKTKGYKEYTYTISEEKGTVENTEYDDTVYTVTVRVSFNSDAKTLNAEIQSVTTNKSTESLTGVTNDYTFSFTNTYNKPESPKAALKLGVKKIVNGNPPADNEFTFNISGGERTSDETGVLPTQGDPKSVTVTKDQTKYFGEISFDADTLGLTEEGSSATFEYEISEVIPDPVPGGWTYGKSKKVTVTVTRTDSNTLELAVSGADISEDDSGYYVEIENTYSASGSFEVEAEKEYIDTQKTEPDNKISLENTKFTFILTAQGEAEKAILGRDSVTVQNDGSKVTFGPYNVSKTGTFNFTLTEKKENALGVTYDETSHDVTVTVTDNGDGTLKTDVKYDTAKVVNVVRAPRTSAGITIATPSEPPVFTNYYTKPDGSVQFSVTKTLSGNGDWSKVENKTFQFKLTESGAEYSDTTSVTVSSGKSSSGLFKKIEYSDVGEHTYVIEEVPGSVGNGITYDNTQKTVKINVIKDTDNKLKVQVYQVYDDETGEGEYVDADTDHAGLLTFTFDNTYDVEPTDTVLKITKDLAGNGDWSKDSVNKNFTFELKDNEGKVLQSKPLSFTGTEILAGTKAKEVVFDKISYTTAGTYNYTISEQDHPKAGTVNVTVVVEDNGKGALEVKSVTYKDGISTITNTLNTSATPKISVKKVLKGNGNWSKVVNKTFKFELWHDGEMISSVTVNGEETKAFTDLPELTEEKTYTYTIKEVGTPGSGVVFGAQKDITVESYYDDNGMLQIRYPDGSSEFVVEYENTYNVSETTHQFTAKKIVTGETHKLSGFTFNIVQSASDVTKVTITNPNVTTQANGTATFAPITFTKAGEYHFTVTEVNGDEPGMSYDTTEYTATVTVTDNGEGQLVVGPVVITPAKGDSKTDGDTMVFNNEYHKPKADTEIKVTKTFTGRQDDKWLEGDKFTFKLTAEGENVPMPESDTVTIDGPNQTKSFGKINYTIDNLKDENGNILESKSYTYHVAEVDDEATHIAGVTYDTHTETITVTLTYNSEDNSINVAYSGNKNVAAFSNTYGVEPTDTVLKITKELAGNGDWSKDSVNKNFTFELKDNEGKVLQSKPLSFTGTEILAGTKAKEVVFDNIHYTTAGTYNYTISEQGHPEAGTVNVTVVVEDNGKGALEVKSVTYKDGISTITNNFETSVTPVVRISKALSGDWSSVDAKYKVFTFDLYIDDVKTSTVTLDLAKGVTSGSFGDLPTYEAIGTHTYTVKETIVDNAGITKADDWTFDVVVGYGDDGNLKIDYPAGNDNAFVHTFTNKYESKDVTHTFTAKKIVTGETHKFSGFTFNIVQSTSDVTKVTITNPNATTQANGTATFSSIKFTKAGEYHFTVTEVKGDEPGMSYDTTEYTATVTVTDNGEGQLVKSVAITPADKLTDDQAMVFTNEYHKPIGEATLSVRKTISGRNDWNGTFTFTVSGTTNKEGVAAPMPANTSVTLTAADAKGNVTEKSFGKIDLDADKLGLKEIGDFITITYTIKETVPADADKVPGVTYDGHTETITVTATLTNGTDGADDYINVVYTNNKNTAIFVNTYEAKDVAHTFTAKKIVTGETHKFSGFTFNIVQSASDVNKVTITNPNVTTQANGTATFAPITFTKAGEYHFTVTEVKGDEPGMSYDTTEYTATVTVTDNGEGQLVKSVAITPAEKLTDDQVMTFTNDYHKPKADTEIKVTKTFTGRQDDKWLEGDKFTFKLTAEGENVPMPESDTVTIDGPNQTKSFGKINYTIDNLKDENGNILSNKVYTYKVSEVDDATTHIKGVTYDPTVYTVTVTLTLSGDTLTATQVITDESEIVFRNTFAPTTANIEAKKVLKSDDPEFTLKPGQFKFNLTAAEGTPMPTSATASNAADGTVKFGDITFYGEGEYDYELREDSSDNLGGVAYSEIVYNVHISVKFVGDTLTPTVTYTLDGKEVAAAEVVFENSYTAPTGHLKLDGVKRFSGSDLPENVDDLTFGFNVYRVEETGDKYLRTVSVKVSDLTKGYTIENILNEDYTKDDDGKTFIYKIVENDISANDVRYAGIAKDTKTYTVTVDVSKSKQYHALDAVVKKVTDSSGNTVYTEGDKNMNGAVEFVNTYVEPKASTEVNVRKIFDGNWTGKTFTFELKGSDGTVISSDSITAKDGKVTFKLGDYTVSDIGKPISYTVSEVNGGTTVDGITYDKTVYNVTVNVSYANGRLAAAADVEGVDGTTVTFKNTYSASGSFMLRAVKKYTEDDKAVTPANIYKFTLTADGSEAAAIMSGVDTVVTNNGESVTFGPFNLTKEGTYKFNLVETVEDPAVGMTYDTEMRNITVVAKDNDKGGFDITVNGNVSDLDNNTGIEITNKYETGGFSVTKEVVGTKGLEERETREFDFAATLTVADKAYTGSVTAIKVLADGTEVSEDIFTSTADGVYNFTLKHGETVKFSGIPVGVHYSVEETDSKGYTMSVENSSGDIVKGGADNATIKFINHKDKDKVGLSLTKIVSGTDGEYGREFNFIVELSDKTITGTYGGMTFNEGIARVTVRHGETVSATGLPADIGYKVIEVEANTEDYLTTVENESSEKIEEGQTAEVVFTNHRDRKLGNLSVTKTVTGTDGDLTRMFTFTVTVSDVTVNGAYGQMFFSNGTAVITLAHGQTVIATGLPAGIAYTVYETGADDYTVVSYGTTGLIPENGTAVASFTNNKDKKFGDLSVTKTVDGDEGWDPEQLFRFTVTLSDSSISGTYGDMTFSGGVANVTLKAGETATASQLPEGISYTVTEEDVEDFTQSSTGDSGMIVADSIAAAEFVNTYEAPKIGDLSVTKTVTGTAGDPTKLFGFRVVLSDADINGQYGDMFFIEGFATVYLAHGQMATASGLPEGTGYTVIELDSEDYVVSMTGAAGFIIADTTVTAAFINHKDQPETPENPHGDDMNPGVGKDRAHGDDMNAGVGMDDMNPATGDYEAESFANGATSIVILWTMVFLFGAVVIARKRREDR